MRHKSALTIGFAAVLCGSASWGQPSTPQGSSEYQKAYTEAYERSFRTGFRERSLNQCLSSAPKAAAAGYDITPTCTCAADTLLATMTMEQLAHISASSTEVVQAITTECLKTNPPVASSKR